MSLTLVTGGTRGIGAAIATRLADDGHDLVLGYLSDSQAAEETATRIRALGRTCVSVQADLTDADEVERLFAAAAEVGPLTAVVNNAGATYRFASLADTPPEEVRRVVEVNLLAPLFVARAAVLAMRESGGVLVNITSGAATIGSPGEYVHYAASKAGLDTLTRGLGLEVAAQGIRVVAVAPGLIATDLHATTGDAGRVERMAPQIPLGRAGQPTEIAEAVAWLMSDAASYITATTLRVAGGR
ncbi:NAD(P)-dependent dehydrogenase (short-subunit alcohol dehydrogenase family) [Nocardioides daedukensis]|uniref:NAD(P)-dependent dehydrogenase (Short-subunit alcohol dehydrogenase family) n=1 Tax=Nocardioides daedukensis TaxID=634462 RepID=A0A7Y9S0F5_9ACTN|nr:SDR family oxidoreductase [Nocardioides daedukensis]NYG58684.1 NAD(P)-dependent dehydrogenase (short-subunit alcohol dehydrogenase family) [Nocardioides daedukensis]